MKRIKALPTGIKIVLGILIFVAVIGIGAAIEGPKPAAKRSAPVVHVHHHERSVFAVGGEQFFKTHPAQFKAACGAIEDGSYEQSEKEAESEGLDPRAVEAMTIYLERHC